MAKKIKWVGTLSTTRRNNVDLIQVRQNNVNSEVLGFNIVDDNGEPYDLKNRKVLFCTYFDKLTPVEQYAEVIENGKIVYTMNQHDMQKPVRINFAYFKILDEKDNLADTTQNFSYDIMPSIESKCMESKPYIFRLEEVLDAFLQINTDAKKELEQIIIDFNQQVIEQQESFDMWFESIREILESVDPGGILLNEIVEFRYSEILNLHFNRIKDRGRFWDNSIEGIAGNPMWYGAVGDGITDDSEAIIKCFDKHNSVKFPQNKKFKIMWDITTKTYFYNFKNRKHITILGENSLIIDGNEYSDRTLKGVINFENCKHVFCYINAKGFKLENLEKDLGYIGSSLFSITKGTENIEIRGYLEDFRYGLRSGDFGDISNGNNKNIRIKISTKNVGYPFAGYMTSDVELDVIAENVHRASYFAACDDVRGQVIYSGFAMSRMNVLLTNLSATEHESKGCSNIYLTVIDRGSYSNISDRSATGISLQALDGNTKFSKIKFNVISNIDDTSRTLSAFAIKSNLKDEGLVDNWTSNIEFNDVTITGFLDRRNQTTSNSSWGDIHIDCEAIDSANNPIFKLLNLEKFTVLSNSSVAMNNNLVKIPNYSGSILFDRVNAPDVNFAVSIPNGKLILNNSSIKNLSSHLGIKQLTKVSSDAIVTSMNIGDGSLKLPLLNGYKEYGSPFEPFSVFIDVEDNVLFRGLLIVGNSEKNTPIFKLPAKNAPKSSLKRIAATDKGPAVLNINTDGIVALSDVFPVGFTWINLGGVVI